MPAARDEDWTAIAAQAAAGATLEELSQHWNIPLGTLKWRCANEGWKRHAREIQAAKHGLEPTAAQIATTQPRSTDKAVSLISALGERSKLRAAKVGDKTLRAINRKREDELVKASGAYKNTVDALAKVHGWGSESQSSAPLVAIQVVNASVPDA